MKRILTLTAALTIILMAGCQINDPLGPVSHVFESSTQSETESDLSKQGNGISVMTRNIYVGTDLNPILAATDPNQIPVLVAIAFQDLVNTNFPERAEALAQEIAEQRPHLIGLQEVSKIRIQSPGDAVIGGTTPAETVFMDYLEILMDALQARGLHYRLVGKQKNFDVELPMIVSMDPMAFDDVRLTDYNAVLARSDVEVTNVEKRNFQAALPVPGLGSLPQGFIALDATFRNRTIRFVNTHLEVVDFEPIQMAQAQELNAYLQEASLPVVLVGDLNSPAPNGSAYSYFISNGYLDAWLNQTPPTTDPGYTCSHAADLLNTTVNLDRRIDFILYRNDPADHPKSFHGTVKAEVLGDELDDRTPSGLWPSDHAGVVAMLKLHRK